MFIEWRSLINLIGRVVSDYNKQFVAKVTQMPNFLEQLVAEWYEFRGYFVWRNINVGPRPKGGFESEPEGHEI